MYRVLGGVGRRGTRNHIQSLPTRSPQSHRGRDTSVPTALRAVSIVVG